jgi:hypothetical protein
MTFALALFLTAQLHAQTKCPPLPEGATCDRYHYHLSIWNIETLGYTEVTATRQFLSQAACEKARAEALKESALLAEFVRTTKIDTSMAPNHFGDCHCDRTQDTSSASFLDAKTRTAQLHTQQDAGWVLRERLLASRDTPGVPDHLLTLFETTPKVDRFLRETMPPRLPPTTAVRPPATLLESRVGSQAAMPAVAANLTLVPVLVPGTSPDAQQSSTPATVQPPPVPPEPHPPSVSTPRNQ